MYVRDRGERSREPREDLGCVLVGWRLVHIVVAVVSADKVRAFARGGDVAVV